MNFHKVELLAEKFCKLAEDEPDTERNPNTPAPESSLEIGFKPTPDVFQFLRLLQIIATVKNKLATYKDLDPYIKFYIGLLIQSKAGIFRNAIKDSISRNVFNFDDYEAVRTMFKDYVTESNMGPYLERLDQTIRAAVDKVSKEDLEFFKNSLNFIVRELKALQSGNI